MPDDTPATRGRGGREVATFLAVTFGWSWGFWAQAMFPVLDSDPASLAMVGLLALTTLAVVGYWGPTRLVRSDSRPSRSDETRA